MTQAKREGFGPDPPGRTGAAHPAFRLNGEHGAALPALRQRPRLTSPVPANAASRIIDALPLWRRAITSALAAETDHGLGFLFLPVAMGAGAGLFYLAPTDPALWFLVAALFAALMVAVFARKHHSGAARAAAYAAAICVGALAAGLEASNGTILLDTDVTTTISGTVEAREFDAAGRVRYLVRLHATSDPKIRRPPQRVRLTARSPHQAAAVGATITGRARLSSPSGPVMPGGYDFAFRAFVDGIGAHGYFYRVPQQVDPLSGGAADMAGMVRSFQDGLRRVREHISLRIRTVLPGDPGGIAAALAVSDRRGISKPTVDALRATGLAHILAISGLHMALAAGTLYVGIRKGLALFPGLVEAWPVKKFAAIGAMMTATAYFLISGGSVSTQRAWVMLTVMLVAVLADRPALTMRNVALAAIVIILVSPSAVVGPGFQMSFAATAALISAYAVISRRARETRSGQGMVKSRSRLVRGLVFTFKALLGLAITSLVAGLATGLFSAHHFHRVAGAGLLANLLAMPLVTLVVMPAGLVAMLLMPLGLDAWALQIMGQGLEGVVAVATSVNAFGGDISVGQIPLISTLATGAGFVILVFLRSWLRLAGLALIGLGLVLATPLFAGKTPDILISESGKLVGVSGPDGLASNAARPSSFVFSQWQTALRGATHVPPVQVRAVRPDQTADPPAKPNADSLDRLLRSAELQTSRFHCANRGVCAAVHAGVRIVAIDQAALIGAACDRADLVVISIPVYLDACRSGATLVTARTLRRTGSLAIIVQEDQAQSGFQVSQAGDKAGNSTGAHFRIDAAVQGVIRPWTVQRYYEWRTGTFDLPG
ncbi:ComEC/Rec2 family competence protein [uncultured Hoeflea sp.]|uniref:ComEC/Rec2 family competence protein n=1 Tax=uncultured Hoeflea sp. TaxID=538666 RepID=UPI0030EBC1D2|tara:strand:- start:131006 stop:133498 length:2493 start_codon:yes stop_codon:yes gene_type:complete